MKTITINTQAEFDALPKEFAEYTEIYVIGKLNTINTNRVNSHIVVGGNATINDVGGNATISDVGDNATISYARGNATINDVSDNATISYVGGNATISDVGSDATISYVRNNATISYVRDNATINDVGDNATISYVGDNATINDVGGNATINDVGDNATISYVRGNATISYVRDNVTISYVRGNATIRVYSSTVTIGGLFFFATLIMQFCVCKVLKKSKTAKIVKHVKTKISNKDFADTLKKTKDGYILYKSVNPDTLCDFLTGKIKYEGVVTCPDWKPDTDIECGNGLHLSPTPDMALSYNKGKLLKCAVKLNDFAVYQGNLTKVRCSKVIVLGEVK